VVGQGIRPDPSIPGQNHSIGKRRLVSKWRRCRRIDNTAVKPYILPMKTTIDLPDDLLRRAKVAAAQRKTTLKALVQSGLDLVLRPSAEAPGRRAALRRLRSGFRLGGRALTREQTHERG